MATIPTVQGPSVGPGAGSVLQGTRAFQQAGEAGTPGGQGAAIGAGLMNLGQGVGRAGDILAAEALKEQALSNEAMARDADSAAATALGGIYNEYASKEGQDAVGAKDAYMQRMLDARKEALATMPNPEARRMLDSVLTRRVGFYQESIGRYAATEQKKWQARSAQGAARVAADQAQIFQNVPQLMDNLVESGVANIANLGELHGWDKDTTTAEQAAYRGKTYSALIQNMLGQNNVEQAQQTFDRVKDRLDAGSVAHIQQMLLPHVRKQQTQMDYAALGGGVSSITEAIRAQESGGRPGQVSVQGARGTMQVMPDTFAENARPGESFANPADVDAVGARLVAKYEQQYAGDPERVAVAYFSGPGNVSEPGSPNPWKEDRKDGNGKSVSSYVKDVTSRLKKDTTAAPVYERPDFAAMRQRAAVQTGNDPERYTRLLAHIDQAEKQYGSAVDRQVAAAKGAARVAVDQAVIAQDDPKEMDRIIEDGARNIASLGDLYGWNKNDTTAEQAAYRGKAYHAIIQDMLGQDNVDQAQQTFDRVKNVLDAGNRAAISRMLLPSARKKQTQTDLKAVEQEARVPASERPDFDAMRQYALDRTNEDADRYARLLAKINQSEAQYNSTTKAQRDTLGARLNDVQAALADGREVAIPETEIRRLYPRQVADETIGKLIEIRQQGYAYQAVQFSSPAEFAALMAGYEDVGKAPGGTDAQVQAGYAQRAKVRDTLIAARQRAMEALKKDPAVYVGRAPAVAEALASGDQEAYARAALGEQERMGVPEADRRVLPKTVAAGLVQKVMEADPAKTPATLVGQEIAKTYGGMWPAVFRDMVREGLPPDYALLLSSDHPSQVGFRGDMQRMMAIKAEKGGMETLRTAAKGAGVDPKTIDDGLVGVLAQFQETTRFMTKGADLYKDVHEAVRGMAYYYARQGASASQALSQAVGGLLNAKYDFSGSMRVPKGQLGLAQEVTASVQRGLTVADLAGVDAGPIAAETAADLLAVAKRGFWTTNADDTGLVLMGTYKNGATGWQGYEPVRRANGEIVTVPFNRMDAMRNAQRARPPAPPVGGSVMPQLTQALSE